MKRWVLVGITQSILSHHFFRFGKKLSSFQCLLGKKVKLFFLRSKNSNFIFGIELPIFSRFIQRCLQQNFQMFYTILSLDNRIPKFWYIFNRDAVIHIINLIRTVSIMKEILSRTRIFRIQWYLYENPLMNFYHGNKLKPSHWYIILTNSMSSITQGNTRERMLKKIEG